MCDAPPLYGIPHRDPLAHLAGINAVLRKMGIRLQLAEGFQNEPVNYCEVCVNLDELTEQWGRSRTIPRRKIVHALMYRKLPDCRVLWDHYLEVFSTMGVDEGVFLDRSAQVVVAKLGTTLFVLSLDPRIHYEQRDWLNELGPTPNKRIRAH